MFRGCYTLGLVHHSWSDADLHRRENFPHVKHPEGEDGEECHETLPYISDIIATNMNTGQLQIPALTLDLLFPITDQEVIHKATSLSEEPTVYNDCWRKRLSNGIAIERLGRVKKMLQGKGKWV